MPKEWTFAETLESLELRFPWLAIDCESDDWDEPSGADVINELQVWRDELTEEHENWEAESADKANRRANTQRGSIRLTLLAFQAAAAIGIGSGVLSILEWAQGVLGGVL